MPDGLRVRYRIDGVLRQITLPADLSRRVVVALKVMSKMDISENRRPQDGRIGEKYASGEHAELGMDMRVSTLPCVNGESCDSLAARQNPFLTSKTWDFLKLRCPFTKPGYSSPKE